MFELDDAKLLDEDGRVAALLRYDVLDTGPEEPFDKVTALVRTVFQAPFSTISLIDAKRQWLKSCVGPFDIEIPRELSVCTHTIQTRMPLLITDMTADERFAQNPAVVGPPYIRSYLGVPLETPDGYNIGALCAIDTIPREFTRQQVDMLKSFASIVVDELELRNLARIDQLTGAVNRRAFFEEVGKALSRLNRHDHPASIIMFDIDHFKRINDQDGHPAGDAVLRAVGNACVGLTRDTDVFGRLGGEEFGILLYNTSAAGALTAAERYRQTLASLEIPNYPDIQVTASFGIAECVSHSTSESWIADADAALYEAKHNGRNRCHVAKGTLRGNT
jgi:diguanylate cyclase (GGDEF)-like protein